MTSPIRFAALLAVPLFACRGGSTRVSAADSAGVLAASELYRQAWINGDTAAVTYDLVSTQDNSTLLPNGQGKAVKVKGTWKVSQQSFCALIALGGGSC